MCLSVCLPVRLSICKLENAAILRDGNIQNEAILRDFLNFLTRHHPKRSNSARIPHFSNLTISKTKQFCETSFKNGKLHAELTARYQWVLRFFHSICQGLRLPRKTNAKSVIHSAAPVTQNHLRKPEDLMLENATFLRKSAAWPPNISDQHVSCIAPATEKASLQILFKCPTPAIVFGNATRPSRFAHFWPGAQSPAPAAENNASTSKSGASMWCFVDFDFEMCFAPQRRALFRHRNF